MDAVLCMNKSFLSSLAKPSSSREFMILLECDKHQTLSNIIISSTLLMSCARALGMPTFNSTVNQTKPKISSQFAQT